MDNIENQEIKTIEELLYVKPKKINENDIVLENLFETAQKDYDDFNEKAWKKGKGFLIPDYKMIEEKLEGLDSGLYLFAGESNSGKTALMMNVFRSITTCKENNVYGLYYSLDDAKGEIIPRFISMNVEIPIGVSSKPQRYKNMIDDCDNDNAIIFQEYLDKREKGLTQLKEDSEFFSIQDTTKITNSTQLKEHILKAKTFLKSIHPDKKIIIAIDALNDIQLDPKVFGHAGSDDDQMGPRSKFVKDLSTDLDCPIFASVHLRKLNGNRRPILDDLRSANTLVYEASVIWLIFNDVSKNKGGASIFWNDKDAENNLGAIIEIDWAKNKKSSFKGRSFCKFKPNFSLTLECTKDENKRFETLIYQK